MIYRETLNGFLSVFAAWPMRVAFRLAAFAILAGVILHGASQQGAFQNEQSPWSALPGRLASFVGLAADNIQVSGFVRHDPAEALAALALKPGSSLLGFDAVQARQTLEALPWIKNAIVIREYPNALRIDVTERAGLAIWQHKGSRVLIDETGAVMGPAPALTQTDLPLVTGDGANLAIQDLVNQISAIPELSQKISAAARVGKRRWTLYLSNGVRIALPEFGTEAALKAVWELDKTQGLLSKGVVLVDMRIPGQMNLRVGEAARVEETGDAAKIN